MNLIYNFQNEIELHTFSLITIFLKLTLDVNKKSRNLGQKD